MKVRLLFGFALLLVGLRGYAHDPNLATFTVFNVSGNWVMRVDMTTSTLDRSLKRLHPDSYAELSGTAYKEAVVQYLKDNIRLKLDDGTWEDLGPGGIKLGDHSSVVLLTLPRFDPRWTSLQCEISCFQDNEKQSNLLRVKLGEDQDYEAFLRNDNEFRATFSQGTRMWVRPVSN